MVCSLYVNVSAFFQLPADLLNRCETKEVKLKEMTGRKEEKEQEFSMEFLLLNKKYICVFEREII